MFDPRLLKNEYPCYASAYVESGGYSWTMSSGRKANGHWISGIATHAEQGFYVWFIDSNCQWYKICHSEQLRCYGKYQLPKETEMKEL